MLDFARLPISERAPYFVEAANRRRLSRDYYDVCQIFAHPAGQKAMRDLDLLVRVVNLKQTYFRSAWANYDTARPGTLRLVPPDHRLADLKTDYQEMQPMFSEPPPTFDAIIATLREAEDVINATQRCPASYRTDQR